MKGVFHVESTPKAVLESFPFALALAVGLTPQLLPAIVSINLAHGAKRMATQKVIVKRLASIENFGSMNVLCSDFFQPPPFPEIMNYEIDPPPLK